MGKIDDKIQELGFILPPAFPVPETMPYMAMARVIGDRCVVSGHAALNPDGSIAQPLG